MISPMQQAAGICFWEVTPKQAMPLAKPMLMIHGHGGDHRGLEALANRLDGPVILIDLPGFGQSLDLPFHSVEAYVKALKKFVTTQKLSQYHLLGHSLGSGIALALAAVDQRAVSLTLLNPVPEFSKVVKRLLLLVHGTTQKIPDRFASRLVHADLYSLATFLMHSRNRRDVRYAKTYLKSQASTTYSLKAWQESGQAIYNLDQALLAKRINQPTLLIHGDSDAMTSIANVERFSKLFSNTMLKRLSKSGHFVHLEDTTAVAQSVRYFVQNLNARQTERLVV